MTWWQDVVINGSGIPHLYGYPEAQLLHVTHNVPRKAPTWPTSFPKLWRGFQSSSRLALSADAKKCTALQARPRTVVKHATVPAGLNAPAATIHVTSSVGRWGRTSAAQGVAGCVNA
jgi:hypothetical protein